MLLKILFLLFFRLGIPHTFFIVAAELLLIGAIVFGFYFFTFRRQWSVRTKRLLLHLHYDSEILKSKLESQEQTLTAVSAEIHDNVGQQLSLLYFNLERLKETGADVGDMLILLRKAITDLRELSHSFSARMLTEEGLEAAVGHLLAQLNKSKKINATLIANVTNAGVNTDVEFILFRVFQEAVQNILKHAGATEIKVCMESSDEDFVMTIADNGKGFQVDNSSGQGLRNMKARIKLMKGRLSIKHLY